MGNFQPEKWVLSNWILHEEKFEKIFAHKVLKMMLQEDKITEARVEILLSWHKSGFNVHFGDVIPTQDHENREKAVRYLVKPPISIYKMALFGRSVTASPQEKEKSPLCL